jgi:hypothetical protein
LLRPARVVVHVSLAAGLILSACSGRQSPSAPSAPSAPAQVAPPPAAAGPAVLVGAGDIALCGPDLANAEKTAKLLDGIPGTVFTAGDNTQNTGSDQEFRDCFTPTWGRHKDRIRPTPGNHDYGTPGAGPYFNYFGAAAGTPGAGYYSYHLGGWHVVVLNSNLPMHPGSPQAEWLRNDLESIGSRCTAAYWHHPLVSSGVNGGSESVRNAWQMLYQHGAEIVINGHDHMFERYVPQDPFGRPDSARGIRQFIVGTGGCYLYPVKQRQPNSEVQGHTHGVLKLTLRSDGYDWDFIPVSGNGFSDSGSGSCH